MSNFDLDGEMQFEVNLNISRFIRDAVRKKMKRTEIMVYLHLVSITYEATDKMRRFFPVAQENDLSRNEILIWLHIAYGGSVDPRHISRKLRIPIRWVENALVPFWKRNTLSPTGRRSNKRHPSQITEDLNTKSQRSQSALQDCACSSAPTCPFTRW